MHQSGEHHGGHGVLNKSHSANTNSGSHGQYDLFKGASYENVKYNPDIEVENGRHRFERPEYRTPGASGPPIIAPIIIPKAMLSRGGRTRKNCFYSRNEFTVEAKQISIELENNINFFLAGSEIRGVVKVFHQSPCFDVSELRLSLRGYEHFHQSFSDFGVTVR